MRRGSLAAGLLLVPFGWLMACSGWGITGHMAGHMVAVALAAPLIALGLSDTAADPATRWPRIVTPIAMMLVELATIWVWHLPLLRVAAHGSLLLMALEQASFLIAGLLLWTSAIHGPQRVTGVGALLLTSMHMTLLGVLIGLASRPLYPAMHHGGGYALDALTDQQVSGVVMLLVGSVSYMLGGLALLASVIRDRREVIP